MSVFGEESYVQDNPMMNLDQEKLKNAPVNNMDSERAVGSVNNGLKIRGAQEIKTVCSSVVKAKDNLMMNLEQPHDEPRSGCMRELNISRRLPKEERY